MNGALRCEILVVDDEAIVCERLKALLESDGHRVETIVDPAEAIKSPESKAFDIVISDIRMGAIDGIHGYEKVFQTIRGYQGHHDNRICHTGISAGSFDQRRL